jgi:ribosomal protein L7/L12
MTPDDASRDAELLVLVAEGRKIEAIKLYRQKTGVGLKEAKDFIIARPSIHQLHLQLRLRT